MSHHYERVPLQLCPNCGATHTAAGTLSGPVRRPRPGDLTVCVCCAAPLEFDDDLTTHVLRPEDFFKLEPHVRAELRDVVTRVRKVDDPT